MVTQKKLNFFVSHTNNFSTARHTRNTAKFATTMLAPAGVENINDDARPIKKHTIEIIAVLMMTLKKLLKMRIELNPGKTIRLLIIIAPIRRIPITIVSAVKTAVSEL